MSSAPYRTVVSEARTREATAAQLRKYLRQHGIRSLTSRKARTAISKGADVKLGGGSP